MQRVRDVSERYKQTLSSCDTARAEASDAITFDALGKA